MVSINIKEENGKQTVSARELHEKLEVSTQFKDWIKRMIDYGFEEGKDYCSFLSESTGGRPATEYFISIDMAKEICMIQRSDKGRQFRQYFIECEKRLIESNKRAMPQTYIEAVESLLVELKKNQALEEQGKLLLEQKEKAEDLRAHDHYLVKEKYLSATEVKAIVKDKTGENVVMTKVQKILGLEYPDVMYMPFTKGNYHGQQTVYAPEVVDKICDAIEEITE